ARRPALRVLLRRGRPSPDHGRRPARHRGTHARAREAEPHLSSPGASQTRGPPDVRGPRRAPEVRADPGEGRRARRTSTSGSSTKTGCRLCPWSTFMSSATGGRVSPETTIERSLTHYF